MWVIISVLALVIIAVAALYIPPVQTWIKDIALREVNKSTGMNISAAKFRLRFPLSVTLGDVCIVEATGDTMLTVGALDIDVKLLPLLKGDIDINGANVSDAYYALGTPDSAMMLRARVSDFSLDAGSMNLLSGNIDINRAALDGADVTVAFNDSVASPQDTSTTASSPLRISATDISLKNVRYRMAMLPVIDSLDAVIPEASLKHALVDMGARTIRAESLAVDSVSALYLTPSAEWLASYQPKENADTAEALSSAGDMWRINADKIYLTASSAIYAMRGADPLPGLDMNYLSVSGVVINVDSFYNCGSAITVPLKRIKATERCGLSLDAHGLFAMDSTLMRADSFDISTTFSRFTLNAAMGMGDLTKNDNLPLRLKAAGNLALADIQLAMPSLAPLLKDLPRRGDIALAADIDGTTGSLSVNNISANLPGFASFKADGNIGHPFDFDRMTGRVTFDGKFSNLNTVKPTLLEARMAKQVNIPPMVLSGTVNYNPGIIAGNANLMAAGGKMALKAGWKQKAEGYNATLNLDGFPVDAFMPSLGVGAVTAVVDIDGHGYDPANPRTAVQAKLDILHTEYMKKVYSDISAEIQYADNHATGSLSSDNPEAEIDIDFTADITKTGYTWNIDGNVHYIDLMAMQLSPTPNHGSFALKSTGNMSADAKNIMADATVTSLDWELEGKKLFVPEAALTFSADSAVAASLTSGDLNMRAAAMCSLDTLLSRISATTVALDSAITRKNADITALQKVMPPLDIRINAGRSNVLADYLAADGIGFSNANASFRNDSLLSLTTGVTGFTTGSTRLDTISFGAVQHGKFLAFKGALNNRPGTMDDFAHVNLTGFLANDKIGLLLTQRNIAGERGFLLGLNATLEDSVATVKFVPYTPTIGYKKWELNHDNYISYNFLTRHIDANLAMNSGKSFIKIYTEHVDNLPENQEDLIVQLSDIHLQDWLSISPFAPPVKGDLGADMRIHWDEGQLTGKGTVSLADLFYGRDRVGSFDVGVDVATNAAGVLRADASLLVDSIKVITARGSLNDSTAAEPFMLDFSMIHFPLRIVNPFLPKEYARLSGMLNGKMDITGSLAKPVFNGYLDFDSTEVNVGMLGQTFKFSEDKIPVDSSVVHFNGFTITGANANPLKVDGTVDLRSLTDMKLNLAMNARNMQIVNSSRPRKADVYGKAFIDLNAKVRGDMSFLDIDANLKLLSGTNVTYILGDAESALTSQSTGDMVKFVQFSDTAAVAVADSLTSTGMAMNLEAELTIQQGTTINVDLSTDGKNKVSVAGQGTLDYSLNPFNDGRLTGRFNINSGYVRYTPPMMSEKLFNFQEGSFISFNGNMLNPILNVHAVDRLKANVTQSGQNSRLITFNVGLSVTGTLANMNVAFDLSTNDDITVQNELSSMSPDQRANQAMNLLLYNVYSGPGTKANTNLSGNPLYSFLTSQLNSWAANNIRGVDLSFGIDQYDKTVNGSTSQTTSYSYRVSKTLFNDRFKIIVGGNYSTDANADENFSQNLINDIAFEYMLNRSGSMYVRIFRHTGYESILEGEVTQTGVGFVLRRKINSLRDLFRWAGRLKRSITGENKKTSSEREQTVNQSDVTDETADKK